MTTTVIVPESIKLISFLLKIFYPLISLTKENEAQNSENTCRKQVISRGFALDNNSFESTQTCII